MADIVNLRKARKAKTRAEADATAQANRIKHGRTKAEKDNAAANELKAQRKHEGHKRDGD